MHHFAIDYDEDEQMEFTQSDDIQVLGSFESMGLKEDLLRGIYSYGKLLCNKFVVFNTIWIQVLKDHQPFNREQSNRLSREEMSSHNHSQELERLQCFLLVYFKT
jgi:hypothetical protein